MAGEGEPAFKSMISATAAAVAQARDDKPAQTSLPLRVVGDMRESEAIEADAKLPGKRGRPPGAKNRSTEDWVAFIRARYTDPAIALAELYNRPLEDLILELKLLAQKHGLKMPEDIMSILKVQVTAAEALMPYMHSKQPIAVQVDASGHVTLNIIQGGPEAPQNDGAPPIIDVTPNQGDSDT